MVSLLVASSLFSDFGVVSFFRRHVLYFHSQDVSLAVSLIFADDYLNLFFLWSVTARSTEAFENCHNSVESPQCFLDT